MANTHDIDTYLKLAEAISFYLRESFHYMNEALIHEYALVIFAEEIYKIEPTDDDRTLMENFVSYDSLIDAMQAENISTLSDETINKMAGVWSMALQTARVGKHAFNHQHEVNSIEILGHLNNFGFFIETLVNRHMLFLNHSNEIDNLSYSRIVSAKISERLVYIFKNELKSNTVHVNEIFHLFSLRNKTVHYTPDNAQALKVKLSELFQIWKQAKVIIEQFELKEKFSGDKFSDKLEAHIIKIKQQWT